MLIEQFLIANWYWFVIVTSALIFVKWWMKFVTDNRRLAIKKAREQVKNDSSFKQDIDAYIMQPEDSIKALMIKRGILEKEKPNGYQTQIETIDQQIKWLQTASKIPPMFRKPAAHAGNALMKKAESWIGDL